MKDPHFFSKSAFNLINTAFGVKEETEEIEVTDEDLETLEPQVVTSEEQTVDGININHDVTVDDEHVKIGDDSQPSEPT